MQTLAWYVRRLSVMTPAECLWRLHAAGRDRLDRVLAPARRTSGAGRILAQVSGADRAPLIPAASGEPEPGSHSAWRSRLLDRATAIAQGRLDLFDQTDRFVGDPPLWNHDHSIDQPTPMTFSPSIDYRDRRVTGDAKVVWEPNRHHHLVVLGRAWRLTGDASYARAAVRHIESWIEQCPLGLGMNWRSPLELAIRAINWVWTHALLRGSDAVSPAFERRWLMSLGQHVWEISRKYSRGSSTNNHLIGEAAGVYIACSYLPELRDSRKLRVEARRILERAIVEQTYADGGSREQALGYQLFVMQIFVAVVLMARASADSLAPAFWARLERMFEFLAVLRSGGTLPMYGDADDGRVLDYGCGPSDADPLLAIGAVLFDRSQFAPKGADADEALYWHLGPAACERFRQLQSQGGSDRLESRALPDSGLYLLQWGQGPGGISVVMDCGELGMGALAAHGHADALSIHLRVGGAEILVDPGTYDYFSYPSWRKYFRGTAAHNTITVDGQDQSEMLGPFLWGLRASARCLAWRPNEYGGEFMGEHDGFARLRSGVMHRRSVSLDGPSGLVTIRDELLGTGRYSFALHFHFAETCVVRQTAKTALAVDFKHGRARMEFDPGLEIEAFHGSERPAGGFVSRGYHRRCASASIRASGQAVSQTQVKTVIRIEARGGKNEDAIEF